VRLGRAGDLAKHFAPATHYVEEAPGQGWVTVFVCRLRCPCCGLAGLSAAFVRGVGGWALGRRAPLVDCCLALGGFRWTRMDADLDRFPQSGSERGSRPESGAGWEQEEAHSLRCTGLLARKPSFSVGGWIAERLTEEAKRRDREQQRRRREFIAGVACGVVQGLSRMEFCPGEIVEFAISRTPVE
jgi:hypothetical protein